MAILDDASRIELWAEFMSDQSRDHIPMALNKTDLRLAVNALDDYLSNNAAAINSTIPLPARTSLTVSQKAKLLMYVIQKRYIKGV